LLIFTSSALIACSDELKSNQLLFSDLSEFQKLLQINESFITDIAFESSSF
jgi:hypothetical protein